MPSRPPSFRSITARIPSTSAPASWTTRAARVVQEAGAEVLGILAVIDRHEGGREGIEAAGFRFDALYDMADWPPHKTA